MLNIVILDALTFGETSLSEIESLGLVTKYETTSKDETLERVKDADILITNKVILDESILNSCKNLKLICIAATGMNNVDLETASKLNIEVKNVAGYSTASVITHTFAMMFYLNSSSKYYDDVVKSGEYSKSKIFTDVSMPFHELAGKKWGIIGLGEIGRGVAKVASAFGCEVSYYSTSGKNTNDEYEKKTLSNILEQSDIVSIHAPLNSDTKHLIGHSELLQLKDGAILLNLGRGGIVNEDALFAIIDAKPIKVGLDVLEQEPMKENHPLLKVKNINNLYITPHIAWTSVEARDTLISKIAQNIKEFF